MVLYVGGARTRSLVSDRVRIAHNSRKPGISVTRRPRGVLFFNFRLYFLYRSPVVVRLNYNLVHAIMRTGEKVIGAARRTQSNASNRPSILFTHYTMSAIRAYVQWTWIIPPRAADELLLRTTWIPEPAHGNNVISVESSRECSTNISIHVHAYAYPLATITRNVGKILGNQAIETKILVKSYFRSIIF